MFWKGVAVGAVSALLVILILFFAYASGYAEGSKDRKKEGK